jgi:Pilus assembly protein, PilO.
MIIIGFVILVIVFTLYGFVFHPLFVKADSTARAIRMKEVNLELIKSKVAHLTDLQQSLDNAQMLEKVENQNIPTELMLAELYSSIGSLAKASGLGVKQITSSQTFQPFSKNRRLQYYAVEIEGNAYFPQVVSFLDLLVKSNFLIQVENIDLSSISKGSKPKLHFKLTLDAFEYSPDFH